MLTAKQISMNNKVLDWWISMICGVVGGGVHFTLLQISSHFNDLMNLAKAGITAFVCGALGIAGKHAFNWVSKKFFTKKVKK